MHSNALSYAARLSPYPNKGPLGREEIIDPSSIADLKIDQLFELLSNSKHAVIHTGAGVSTSCGIPDFRGPSGVWTLEAKRAHSNSKEVDLLDSKVQYGHNSCPIVGFEVAMPSRTHIILKELCLRGIIKYIITQNIDGLHSRCHTPFPTLSEVHGNTFLERCDACARRYLRDFSIPTISFQPTGHLCGLCDFPPSGICTDTLLDWHDKYENFFNHLSTQNSHRADFHLGLGSSFQIQPACRFPGDLRKPNAALAIVNYQPSALANQASLNIHDNIENVMEEIAKRFNISSFGFTRSTFLIILRLHFGCIPPSTDPTSPPEINKGGNGLTDAKKDVKDYNLKHLDYTYGLHHEINQYFLIRCPCIIDIYSSFEEKKDITITKIDPLRGVWIVKAYQDCKLTLKMWFDNYYNLTLYYNPKSGLTSDIWQCHLKSSYFELRTSNSNEKMSKYESVIFENKANKNNIYQLSQSSILYGNADYIGGIYEKVSIPNFAPLTNYDLPKSLKEFYSVYCSLNFPSTGFKHTPASTSSNFYFPNRNDPQCINCKRELIDTTKRSSLRLKNKATITYQTPNTRPRKKKKDLTAYDFPHRNDYSHMPNIYLQLNTISSSIHSYSHIEDFHEPIFLLASSFPTGSLVKVIPNYLKPERRWVQESKTGEYWLPYLISIKYHLFNKTENILKLLPTDKNDGNLIAVNFQFWNSLQLFPIWLSNYLSDLLECL